MATSSGRLSKTVFIDGAETYSRVPTHLENPENLEFHAWKNLGISKEGHFHGKFMEFCFSYPQFFSISE